MGKKSDQSGQAILEYVMVLLVILSIGFALQSGIQVSRDKFWKRIICHVTAPCPGCAAPDSAKNVLPKGGDCPK
ncbi:MAG: hypothetical protein KGP28_08725 [Bdellovibrionales bacterium]|nr:hypothetical protein [Bdellovibrionales bacterium]